MSPCCQTPYMARLEKIKQNRPVEQPFDLFGDSVHTNASPMQAPVGNGNLTPAPVLPPDEMAPVVTPVLPPSGTTAPNPMLLPAQPGGSAALTPISDVISTVPSFSVPANPLLPPGYQEILDYDSLQYLNGFYRTQIGRFVRVDQLIGSNEIQSRYGFLIGVGINYILLQDPSNKNVSAIDSYSIKYFYVYYNRENVISDIGAFPAATSLHENQEYYFDVIEPA